MTTNSHSNVRTGVSTRMHIAMPQVSVRRPPAYGVPFSLAAILLSLLGVGMSYDVEQDSSADEVSIQARE